MFYLIILITVPVLFLLWEREMAALTIIVVRLLSTKHNPFLENSMNSAVHARQNMYLLYNVYVCV